MVWMYAFQTSAATSHPATDFDALASLLEQKDPATSNHCRRVVHFAESLARRARLGEADLVVVRYAALLHDVGKVRIPSEILEYGGPLNDAQMMLIRQHPRHGEEMLMRVGGSHVAHVARAVGAHHEWFDGGGYPRGLAGSDIPLVARIVAVCDAYDAMTSGRPYAPKRTPGQAVEELIAWAGRQFDPDLVKIFVSMQRFNEEVIR